MSGTRIFVNSLAWSTGTVLWGIFRHQSFADVFHSVWDVTGFAAILAVIIWLEGRA